MKIINQMMIKSIPAGLVVMMTMNNAIFAADDAKTFMSKMVDWIILSIGPGIVAVGFVMAGIAFFKSEQEGIKKAITVIIGGAFMGLAVWLSELVFNWAGKYTLGLRIYRRIGKSPKILGVYAFQLFGLSLFFFFIALLGSLIYRGLFFVFMALIPVALFFVSKIQKDHPDSYFLDYLRFAIKEKGVWHRIRDKQGQRYED